MRMKALGATCRRSRPAADRLVDARAPEAERRTAKPPANAGRQQAAARDAALLARLIMAGPTTSRRAACLMAARMRT